MTRSPARIFPRGDAFSRKTFTFASGGAWESHREWRTMTLSPEPVRFTEFSVFSAKPHTHTRVCIYFFRMTRRLMASRVCDTPLSDNTRRIGVSWLFSSKLSLASRLWHMNYDGEKLRVIANHHAMIKWSTPSLTNVTWIVLPLRWEYSITAEVSNGDLSSKRSVFETSTICQA